LLVAAACIHGPQGLEAGNVSCCGGWRWRRSARLRRRRSHDYRNRVAKLHDVVYQDLHIISTGHFKLDLREYRNVGRVESSVLKAKLNLAFAQHGGLVGRHETHGFSELANAGGPPVEDAKLQSDHRELGHADEIDNADEKEVPGHLLANFLAQKRTLKIG
jgi:hypothetical protein